MPAKASSTSRSEPQAMAAPVSPIVPDLSPAFAALAPGQVELREKKPNIDFPFKLTVEHGPLDFAGMFRAAEAFDFYEVRGIAGENVGKARRDLCVDVMEVTPTATTLHVTPAKLMSYADIAAEMENMVTGIARQVLPGGKVKGLRVQWMIASTGIPSDLRGRLRSVN
ncbi:MAG TPA: hypothetical protein VM286_01880 [Candidatus Thermoplasmatota archaeon]|nr:hypothetical protein [Candidatus Thermoplasmatota archaeon]